MTACPKIPNERSNSVLAFTCGGSDVSVYHLHAVASICRGPSTLTLELNPPIVEYHSSTNMSAISKPSRPPPPILPGGWIAIWDEETQRYYYCNQVTHVTQWEVPTAPSVNFPPPPASPMQPPSYQPLGVYQQLPGNQQYQPQTVIVEQTPVAVPVRGRGVRGLATGLLVGSMMGQRLRRRR